MTWLFRSKSYGPTPPSPLFHDVNNKENKEEEEELDSDDDIDSSNPVSTPFISPVSKAETQARHGHSNRSQSKNRQQFAILDIVVAALKKSLVTYSVERDDEDVSSLDISWPTGVRHVSHVTFDSFNGFLGLPSELEPEVPTRVPSASAKVFGVSAKSMQCSYDERGNSVPTILLMMQKQLYSDGGLKAEGIFRINAENSQEEFGREQLNKGLVPHGIDVHCLSGLMKAWFRELPTGVLDSLTPEQVMQCNTEEDCTNLVKLLPSTEAALLDWAVNLMADVVENEQFNKMNARNVAMVFSPNMTQMGDPLTALIRAVQVMNFLKILILKTLQERQESVTAKAKLLLLSCKNDPYDPPPFNFKRVESCEQTDDEDACDAKAPTKSRFSRTSTLGRIEWSGEKLWKSEEKEKGNGDGGFKPVSSGRTHSRYEASPLENNFSHKLRSYDSGHWLRLRKGVRKLCRHPLFQLSKPTN